MNAPLRVALAAVIVAGILAVLLIKPGKAPERIVTVYTSVDSEYAEKLAERFTQATGIAVQLSTDSEISKTTGMLEQLRAFKQRPLGDVFWNSELSGTLVLAREGLFEPYTSLNAAKIPERFKDPKGLWTGFGLRARVLIFNTNKMKREQAPKSIEDLAKPEWRGQFCIARPMYGTTRSHLVSLVLALGEEKGLELLRKIRANGSEDGKKEFLVDGNSAVRDRVSDGTFNCGLTDTDDVYEAMDRKSPVDFLLIEQTASWPGVYVIPNVVSVLNNAPHKENAHAFVDFLLRPETEAFLAEQGARQIPVRAEVPVPVGRIKLSEMKTADPDYKALDENLERLSEKIDRLLRGIDP